MQLAKIEVNDFGGAPFCEHNMPCPVCGQWPAVLVMDTGVFEPCWECQSYGWQTLRRKRPWWMFWKGGYEGGRD